MNPWAFQSFATGEFGLIVVNTASSTCGADESVERTRMAWPSGDQTGRATFDLGSLRHRGASPLAFTGRKQRSLSFCFPLGSSVVRMNATVLPLGENAGL